MKRMLSEKKGITPFRLILGGSRFHTLSTREGEHMIRMALDAGINCFDLADLYGEGQAESTFGKALNKESGLREKVYLQSKCGIRKGYYDLSREHLIQSVEESLKRLQTEYLDLLLLHRPDALVEPEEVAEAFSELYDSGKVRAFGVSNHHMMQIELLKKYVRQPLTVNQLQISLVHSGLISTGLHMNAFHESPIHHNEGLLDYCRLNGISLQAWAPLSVSQESVAFLDHENYPELNRLLVRMAEWKNATPAAVALAWLLRHPAEISPVVGTTKPERLSSLSRALEIALSRQEWYALYHAAGNRLL